MSNDEQHIVVREVTVIFHDLPGLQAAVDELRAAGFQPADINLLGPADAIREHLGRDFERVEELDDAPNVPRSELPSSGVIAHDAHIDDQLARGGLIVWVTTADQARVEAATEILRRLAPPDRHLHFHKAELP